MCTTHCIWGEVYICEIISKDIDVSITSFLSPLLLLLVILCICVCGRSTYHKICPHQNILSKHCNSIVSYGGEQRCWRANLLDEFLLEQDWRTVRMEENVTTAQNFQQGLLRLGQGHCAGDTVGSRPVSHQAEAEMNEGREGQWVWSQFRPGWEIMPWLGDTSPCPSSKMMSVFYSHKKLEMNNILL